MPTAATGSRRVSWPLLLTAVIALAYAGGHLVWYRATPLGQVPVLDERENLAFAEAIVRGELPREPFYRAPGYALLLAAFRWGGGPSADLFAIALFLGVALHALNAGLIAHIARRLFGGQAVALLAGLLFALHPVLVHFSTQALDAVPALTLFLVGLTWLAPSLTTGLAPPVSLWRWAATSLAWAAATVLRPNYLLLWGVLLLLALRAWRQGARGALVPAAAAGAVVFAAVAGWQGRVSGEFGFLPWQGTYNLWAANQPGAHGRYYVQQHPLPHVPAHQNPARAESFLLYRLETGREPPDIATLNAHWRARLLAHLVHHPLAWLGQLARKTYALLNNWEQYNNKTFAFHRDRSPWLRWNPLGWGLLFVLGIAGAARLAHEQPAVAPILAVPGLVTAASIVVVFVSARFRLPLAALATILAGGALAAPRFWRTWPRPRQLALAAALALAAMLTFSRFDGVRDRATFVQDHALLARAADTVGDDALAWREASAALALQPLHRDALRLAVASYFNHLIATGPIPGAEAAWRDFCGRLLGPAGEGARDLQAVAALALWRAGQTHAALETWRRLGSTPAALAARLLAGDLPPDQLPPWPADAWHQPLVRLAALRFNLTPPAGVDLGDAARAGEAGRRIFAVSPAPPSSP